MGRELRLETGGLVRLPWGHDVRYAADERAPFQVGTIHLVPWHSADVPVEPVVPHLEGDRFYDVPWRHGGDLPVAPRMLPQGSEQSRRFLALATYCIELFASQQFDERSARALGELVTAEGLRSDSAAAEPRVPPALAEMMAYVVADLRRPLSVGDIAAAGDCSPATAQRLFRRHTGESLMGWVRARRMTQAARLIRSTGLRVSEVGRSVGIDDPLYFSRLFRAAFGESPTEYRGDRVLP
ncbi:MAG: helix-turn-helix transcriptional regulator [Microbacterium sp.]